MNIKLEISKIQLLKHLNYISNNAMVNKFVSELINHGSITNFFYEKQSYKFYNDKGEKIIIQTRPNGIDVSSTIDGIIQQFEFFKEDDGYSIFLNISTNIEWPNYSEKKKVRLNAVFDIDGKLLWYKIDNKSYLNSIDLELDDKIKNNIYDNYNITSYVYVDGDKLLKKEIIKYLHDCSKKSVCYYCSPYSEELIDDVYSFVKPKFVEISEEDYNKNMEKSIQKKKNMI